MRPHQFAGVKFMYDCVMGKNAEGCGCILADEMYVLRFVTTINILCRGYDWWIVWFTSVWSIWLYRNNTVFKQEVPIPKFECVSVNYICR